MDPFLVAEFFITAFLAGILGALLGIGGGIIIVPVLSLFFHVPIHLAIGASIVAVVATSSASATVYVKEGFSNIRLGMFLEIFTSAGALVGAIAVFHISGNILSILFSVLLLIAARSMHSSAKSGKVFDLAMHNDRMAERLRLNGGYIDPFSSAKVEYFVEKTPQMAGVSLVAGVASGLLGVGGGFIIVPAMVDLGKIPMKAASATSNFMIGVTAGTSAIILFTAGFVDPTLTAPIALGTLFGAFVGSRLMGKLPSRHLKEAFAVLLLFVSLQLFLKALNVY